MSSKNRPKTKPVTSDQIAKDIAKAAKLAGVEPTEVTKLIYYKNGGLYQDWDLRRHGGFALIKATYFPQQDKSHAEIGELKEVKKQYSKIEKELQSSDLWLKKIKESISSIPAIKVKPFKTTKPKGSTKRTVNLLLSDLHFGSDLDPKETGHKWGKEEESRCFAKIVKNVCSYKTQYRKDTKLCVSILGDIIENELHGGSSAAPIHEQTCRAIHLLSQGIARFSEAFPEVEVYFAVGNHGRDIGVHHGRATAQKWNAVETTIYYAVKTACRNLRNVKFFQPMTPWVTYSACGHRIYNTHGDTNFNVGNPNSTVGIKSIENSVNRLNSSLADDEKYAVVGIGHVHLSLSVQLANGTFVIMNGALVPPNSYAQTFNIMNSPQNQVLWESTKDYAVGDQRFISASGAETDTSLDSYIVPFKSIDE